MVTKRRSRWSAACPAGSAKSSAGSELREPDQAEHERIAAAGVALPPERGLHSERRRGGEELARQEQGESALHEPD